MLKMPETIVCGDIGLVLLSGLGSRRTHPVGAEGATMARRAPFPLSSIPAYIDQSMKLIVCRHRLWVVPLWTCCASRVLGDAMTAVPSSVTPVTIPIMIQIKILPSAGLAS